MSYLSDRQFLIRNCKDAANLGLAILLLPIMMPYLLYLEYKEDKEIKGK